MAPTVPENNNISNSATPNLNGNNEIKDGKASNENNENNTNNNKFHNSYNKKSTGLSDLNDETTSIAVTESYNFATDEIFGNFINNKKV